MEQKSIYIIDDDHDILEALAIFFQEVGFHVIMSDKGEKVFEETKQLQPNVVLLDLLLSGSDGGTITKLLKEDKETKDIPVVIVSAHPKARKRALECGADAFLAKPFDLDELYNIVHKYMV